MDGSRSTAMLAQLDELDRRDQELAGMLGELARLTEEVQALRHEASETVAGLERLPSERAGVEVERTAARTAVAESRGAHALAEAALADLERARKPHEEDIERARKALKHAADELHDASARSDRADGRLIELDELEAALGASAEGLVVAARTVTERLQAAPRVADAGKGEPGPTVDELDEWGARARAALFVAHSTLASERERVLHEANALGAAVLGGESGAVSVALLRQRVIDSL